LICNEPRVLSGDFAAAERWFDRARASISINDRRGVFMGEYKVELLERFVSTRRLTLVTARVGGWQSARVEPL
jgi:hypothetical protein